MENNIAEVAKRLKQFTLEREWDQFHNPKNLAISLALEAAEVLEHFQWKHDHEITEYVENNKEELGDEMADVFLYLLHLCRKCDIDIIEVSNRKMDKNEKKYPVEKSRGRATKYTKL